MLETIEQVKEFLKNRRSGYSKHEDKILSSWLLIKDNGTEVIKVFVTRNTQDLFVFYTQGTFAAVSRETGVNTLEEAREIWIDLINDGFVYDKA
jgi:hypothetical protein